MMDASGALTARAPCFWQASSELEDVPRPETHGKAHHTPASCATEAPDHEPAQKQMRLPASSEPNPTQALDGQHSISPADAAAIEALTGASLADAIETAVREESLADARLYGSTRGRTRRRPKMLPNVPESLQRQSRQRSGAARARVLAKLSCTASQSTPNGATTTKPG